MVGAVFDIGSQVLSLEWDQPVTAATLAVNQFEVLDAGGTVIGQSSAETGLSGTSWAIPCVEQNFPAMPAFLRFNNSPPGQATFGTGSTAVTAFSGVECTLIS